MTTSNHESGFAYVATGEQYVSEALRSAESLRQHTPGYPICLITDQTCSSPLFDVVIQHPSPRYSFVDKTKMTLAPFERVIFLDTDTLLFGDISDLFQLLDRFDLGATLETLRGWDYVLPDVPPSFAEYTTGLVAFRRTDNVLEFFQDWEKKYDQLLESHPDQQQRFRQNQPSFRYALYSSELRIASIPSEYQFIINYPNYIMWKALLLHGKGDLLKIGQEVNRDLRPRVYLPDLGVFSGFFGKRFMLSEMLRFVWRGFFKLWKEK